MNFLIKLCGGITPDEFAQLITAHVQTNKTLTEEVQWLRRELEDERIKYDKLQDIIFRRHNVILPEDTNVRSGEHLQPLSQARESWPRMRSRLEAQDRQMLAKQREAKVQVDETEKHWKGKNDAQRDE